MDSPKQKARFAGWLYLLMSIPAGLSLSAVAAWASCTKLKIPACTVSSR